MFEKLRKAVDLREISADDKIQEYIFQTPSGEKFKLSPVRSGGLDSYAVTLFLFEHLWKNRMISVITLQQYIKEHDSTKSIISVERLGEILTELEYTSIIRSRVVEGELWYEKQQDREGESRKASARNTSKYVQ